MDTGCLYVHSVSLTNITANGIQEVEYGQRNICNLYVDPNRIGFIPRSHINSQYTAVEYNKILNIVGEEGS